jgi:hypothetical protein
MTPPEGESQTAESSTTPTQSPPSVGPEKPVTARAAGTTRPNRPKVGIVGHSQAGKTTFLATLRGAFARLDMRAEAALGAGAYLEELESFAQNGVFPPKTTLDGKDRRVGLEVSHPNGQASLEIDFFDPAGETFDRSIRDTTEHERAARQRILTELQNCTGLIVLMDPASSREQLSQTFTNSVLALRSQLKEAGRRDAIDREGRLTLRVALLFTKADLLSWQSRERIRDAAAWLHNQSEHSELLRNAETQCVEIRYYFCSSTGWVGGRPNLRTVVRPRPLHGSTDRIERSSMRGEQIPDPALTPREMEAETFAKESNSSLRFMMNLPIFTDPLRLVSLARLDDEKIEIPEDRYGVYNLFGRRVGHARQSSANEGAWNVAEPVLWAARVQS